MSRTGIIIVCHLTYILQMHIICAAAAAADVKQKVSES